MSAATLKLVPAAPQPTATATADLQRALQALESRGRHATRKLARKALVEVAQVVALVGLHLPCSTKRQRDYERSAIDPILAAIDAATGHCPRCGVRVATWAAPAGPLAFVPCATHRAGGAS